jgi:hypothetical protein
MCKKNKIKKIIEETIVNSISGFAKNCSTNKKNTFQVLDLLIPKERKIRSIVGGLETSLGTTLWEPLVKSLALNNGFEVVQEKLKMPKNLSNSLQTMLTDIISQRNVGSNEYTPAESHEFIKNVCSTFKSNSDSDFVDVPEGRGVDVWLRKDDKNYLFDIKTVRPNVQAYKSYMEQILYWYAYFYSEFPKQEMEAYIVFPYNPYEGDFWSKTIGGGKPLSKGSEAQVADEFWGFCSGVTGTYDMILNSFKNIRKSKALETVFDELLRND